MSPDSFEMVAAEIHGALEQLGYAVDRVLDDEGVGLVVFGLTRGDARLTLSLNTTP